MKKIIYLLSLLYCNSVVFAETEYKKADKRLNETYQQVLKTLPDESKKNLKDAQRSWIQYRDNNCIFSSKLGNASEVSCKTDVTLERVKELDKISNKPSINIFPSILKSDNLPVMQYQTPKCVSTEFKWENGQLCFDEEINIVNAAVAKTYHKLHELFPKERVYSEKLKRDVMIQSDLEALNKNWEAYRKSLCSTSYYITATVGEKYSLIGEKSCIANEGINYLRILQGLIEGIEEMNL